MPYNGKEPCAGCKRPGSEVSRDTKNDLCWDCEKIYALGKAKDKSLEEHVRITAWPNNMSNIDFDDNSLTHFMYEFLKAIDNPTAETTDTITQPFNRHNHLSSLSFVVPKRIVEPLTEYFKTLQEYIHRLSDELKAIEPKAREAVQKEKDRIYNEGIEKGRNLLMQLNAGSITYDDFEKNLTYKPKDEK